jgi:hypothetical protein
MTLFRVKIGSKSTFLKIILLITQNTHSKSSYMAAWARKSCFRMILQILYTLNHFKVTRFAVKSKNMILTKIVKILKKQIKWPYMHI